MSPLVHVSRDGAPLGQFRRDLIADLIENGTLQESDLYFEETRRQWLPLNEIQSSAKFIPARPKENPDSEEVPNDSESSEDRYEEQHEGRENRSRRRRRRRRNLESKSHRPRKRHPAESALPGWIAALFALGAAAALWAWATSLQGQLQLSKEKVQELEQALATLQRHRATLLEMAPPGAIRGVITYESEPGHLNILSGVSVSAYRLDDVRRALLRIANLPSPATEEEFASMVGMIEASLPPPVVMELSDANGRFELIFPETGNYALVATALQQIRGISERLLWTLEVSVTENPSPIIALSSANASSVRKPTFSLTPVRQ